MIRLGEAYASLRNVCMPRNKGVCFRKIRPRLLVRRQFDNYGADGHWYENKSALVPQLLSYFRMARGRPTKVNDLDWHLEPDQKKRRRAQNRIAQRKFSTLNSSVKPIHSGLRRYLANKAQGRRRERRLALLPTSSRIRRARDKKIKCAQVSTLRATIKRFGIWDGHICNAKGASMDVVEIKLMHHRSGQKRSCFCEFVAEFLRP